MTEVRIRNNKMKRQQEEKKQIVILVFTICFVFILAVTLGSTFSKAKDLNSEVPAYKYFTSILIKTDDSLYSIAAENMSHHYDSIYDYISEVQHINSLEKDAVIHAGQYIIIPYYSEKFVG